MFKVIKGVTKIAEGLGSGDHFETLKSFLATSKWLHANHSSTWAMIIDSVQKGASKIQKTVTVRLFDFFRFNIAYFRSEREDAKTVYVSKDSRSSFRIQRALCNTAIKSNMFGIYSRWVVRSFSSSSFLLEHIKFRV